MPEQPVVPPALRPGDRIAVVAPCSPVLPGTLEPGLDVLRHWGLEPVVMPHATDVHGHLAGTDEARIADLDAAFADPTLRAVWAVRGGYGLTRIVHRLDWDALAADPVWLVGFSDVTALHQAAWRRLRLMTCHGQFVGRLQRQEGPGLERLRALLFGETDRCALTVADLGGRVLAPGRAEGVLLGGNLAVTCAQLGTPDALSADGAVLLLEDVGEAPYAVDRLLTQADRTGLLDGALGVVCGTFVNGDPPVDRPSGTVDEVLADHLAGRGIPVVTGWPLGHTDRQLPLPLGAPAVLDTVLGTLEVTVPAAA